MTELMEGPPPPAHSSRRLVALLMAGALLSKMLGFVREVLIAQVLGASLVADSFRAATTGMLLPIILLQNEGVPAILIPLHQAWATQGVAVRRSTALTIGLTGVAIAIMLTLELFAPLWISLIVGGFSAEGQALTLAFFRIMATAMPASVMLNVLAAAEISRGRSRLTSVRAAVLNVAVIAGILMLAATGRVDVLAWSFTAAFNGLGAWAVVTLWRDGILSLAGVRARDVGGTIAEFARRLRPLLLQPLAEQGQVWLERVLASRLITGSVASLDYARTLTESAILLVSQPVGLGVLSAGPRPDPRAQVQSLSRPVLALGTPAAMFLALFAPDIVQLVFARGAFDAHAVLLTSQALRGIAAGLWAATLGWILLRMLNSTGRNALAALILGTAYACNAAATLVLTETLGSLGLGLSEAVRGLVLLGGTALALRCGGLMLRLVARALPGALLLGALGLWIDATVPDLFARLGCGIAAGGLALIVNLVLLLPNTCRAWSARARARFGATP